MSNRFIYQWINKNDLPPQPAQPMALTSKIPKLCHFSQLRFSLIHEKHCFVNAKFYTRSGRSVSVPTEAPATATAPGELPWAERRRLAPRSRAKEIDSRGAMH
jgi:hypothetical protein